VIEEGALADLLIVDGDPLADLSGLARDPARTIRVIVKGGRVVKDELSRPAGAVVGAR
jgi:imidazolonepropionase-like amidohydrolase